jgi:hypothetical protein
MTAQLPPHARLINTGCAYWESLMLYFAAKLQLADLLASGPRSATDLAAQLKLKETALYRFMRTLAGMGLFSEQPNHRFALTELGAALQRNAPGSAYASILTLAGPLCIQAWSQMEHSLKTEETGVVKVFGEPLFEYLGKRPEEASLFSETMVGFHGAEPPAVAEAYDFNQFGSIVDCGGATGNMLIHILKKHQKPRGVLYDLPLVVKDAPAFIAQHNMSNRISIESGSFFDSVPAGHDCYIFSHIIHDWYPDQCQTILGNCRKAIKPGGKLLIVEMVLPEGDVMHPGKLLDMMMLVGPGGQERTPREYDAMVSKAGFKMTRVVPTASAVSIVEAVPV